MPSKEHQWLVLWIARKMMADGYRVCGYHGPTPQGGPLNWLPIPPVLLDIRPDVLAVKLQENAFAIGEAKTEEDLISGHSRHQFKVLRMATQVPGWRGKIYVAAPLSAVRALDAALAKAGLAGTHSLVRLHIPDCLVSEGSTVFA
jgi:hypothetical protein